MRSCFVRVTARRHFSELPSRPCGAPRLLSSALTGYSGTSGRRRSRNRAKFVEFASSAHSAS